MSTAIAGACIEWPLSRDGKGYGQSYAAGRLPRRAHRLAWIAVNGPIPEGLVVMHLCDNPPCVNVSHLRLGTQSDNMRDCAAKGRLSPPPRNDHIRGERSPRAKVTAEDVAEIRSRCGSGRATQASLAREYGISPVQVWRIVHGLRWR